jgi:hypothetical protein
MADQNRRSIVCARHRTVEDFILNIDISLLPFSTSEMRASPEFALSPSAKRAPHFLPPRLRLGGEQVCYQSDRHSYFPYRTRHEGTNADEIPIIKFPWRTPHAGPVSVIHVPFASSVICVVT